MCIDETVFNTRKNRTKEEEAKKRRRRTVRIWIWWNKEKERKKELSLNLLYYVWLCVLISNISGTIFIVNVGKVFALWVTLKCYSLYFFVPPPPVQTFLHHFRFSAFVHLGTKALHLWVSFFCCLHPFTSKLNTKVYFFFFFVTAPSSIKTVRFHI